MNRKLLLMYSSSANCPVSGSVSAVKCAALLRCSPTCTACDAAVWWKRSSELSKRRNAVRRVTRRKGQVWFYRMS